MYPVRTFVLCRREAIEQREYGQVAGQVEIAEQVLNRMSERIEEINKLAVGE